MSKRIVSLMLAAVMLFGVLASTTACGGKKTAPDALVIMTEELDGLFNPFFSTTGADATIVSMTQIGMLGSHYENGDVTVSYGKDHAVAVLDYVVSYDQATDKTTYTFVLKNDIVFSDGHPLTMEDVLFNLYVYLDPVYTGSSTMYSTDIVGLQDYRTQTIGSDSTDVDDTITSAASDRAQNRINELINLFRSVGKTQTAGSYSADYNKMVAAIGSHSLSSGYINAVSNNASEVTNANLLADYEETLRLFKEELQTDYISAKEAYLEEPYKSTGEFDEVTSFMYAEGYVTVEYAKDPETNKDIKSKIEKVTRLYNSDVVTDMNSAIDYVYNSKIEQELDIILSYWATANELRTSYAAKAKEVILRANMKDGELTVPNIAGIVSLGHTTDIASVTAQDGTYNVAHEHDADGKPVNAEEYDVLQITINGTDPKAIWNFAFSVAPQHYYAEGYSVDVSANNFGVDYASFDYMKYVIQSS